MGLIKENVNACLSMGLNVSAVVCDMASTNRRALETLGARDGNPVFKIGEKEIVAMFDVPHLLKCFRNIFLKYNIKCKTDISSNGTSGEGLAKWEDIKAFHNNDSSNPNFAYAPILNKDHLDPNTKQKMKVNLAAQTLSWSVAGGMFSQINQGLLPLSAVATANVVLKMDKLFDLCNSSTPDLRRGKPYSTNISDTSPHLKFFSEMKLFFKELEFVGCPRKPPSIDGWIWTMNAIEALWVVIKANDDIKSLAPRSLQQDPLENLFGCIRGNCGSNTNPTTSAFIGGLKTAVLSNMAHITSGNFEEDENSSIMKNFQILLSAGEKNTMSCESTSHIESSVDTNIVEENIEEDSAELQACAYVCGFLIKRHKNNLENCPICNELFVAHEKSFVHNFAENKEYNKLKNSLNDSSKDLILCVEKCALAINALLISQPHINELKKNVTNAIPEETFNFMKKCLEHYHDNVLYVKKSVFHICVQRNCILKNRSFAMTETQAALKKKINIF